MKKILFTFLLVFVGQVIYAQDLNNLMDELAKVESAQKQVVDKAMLAQAMDNEDEDDKMPGFMSKADSVIAVIVRSCPQDVSEKIAAGINLSEKSGQYETLISLKKEDKIISMLSEKREADTDIYVYVSSGDNIVFVKIKGQFTTEDLQNMVKEQMEGVN